MKQTIAEMIAELEARKKTLDVAKKAIIDLDKRINKAKAQFPKVGEKVSRTGVVRNVDMDDRTVLVDFDGDGVGQWVYIDNYVTVHPEPAPEPLYKAGSVVWSEKYDRLFTTTGVVLGVREYGKKYQISQGEVCDGETGWGNIGRVEMMILPTDTPIYMLNGKRSIWDGGDERVPTKEDYYLGQTDREYYVCYQCDGWRSALPWKILVEVIEVG